MTHFKSIPDCDLMCKVEDHLILQGQFCPLLYYSGPKSVGYDFDP